MKELLLLALLALTSVVGALETTTEVKIIGDGHLTAMYDLPDAEMRATGYGNISYTSEGYLTSNVTSLGSEFIVDGPGGWNTYSMSMRPDRFGVEHSVEARAFDQIKGAGIIEVGSDTGEQYFATSYDILSIGGYGEEYIGRGEDGELRDQERIYFGDLTGVQEGSFRVNSSVFEDCIDVPAGEIQWLTCDFVGTDDPALFFDSKIVAINKDDVVIENNTTEDDYGECESCSL